MGRSSHFTHSSVFSFSPPAEADLLGGVCTFSGLKTQLVLSAANLTLTQLTPNNLSVRAFSSSWGENGGGGLGGDVTAQFRISPCVSPPSEEVAPSHLGLIAVMSAADHLPCLPPPPSPSLHGSD